MSGSPQSGTRIIPTLRYRDANTAIDWLCTAFGFERHLVVPDETGIGSRIDMRSLSRQGKSDVGVNAARVKDYMAALSAELGQ